MCKGKILCCYKIVLIIHICLFHVKSYKFEKSTRGTWKIFGLFDLSQTLLNVVVVFFFQKFFLFFLKYSPPTSIYTLLSSFVFPLKTMK